MFQKTNFLGDDVSFEEDDDVVELRAMSDKNTIQEEATETNATEMEEGYSNSPTPENSSHPSRGRSMRKMDGSSSAIEFDYSDHDGNGRKEQDSLFENYYGDGHSFGSSFSAQSSTSSDSDGRRTESSKKTAPIQRKTMVRESAFIDLDDSDQKRNRFEKPLRLAGIDYDTSSDVEDKNEDKRTPKSTVSMQRKTMVRESAFIDLDDSDQKRNRFAKPLRLAGIDYDTSSDVEDKNEDRRTPDYNIQRDIYGQPMTSSLCLPSRNGKNVCSEVSLEIDYDRSDKKPLFRKSTSKPVCKADIEDEVDDDIEDVTEWEESLPNEQSFTIAHGGTENSHTSNTSNDSSSGVIGHKFTSYQENRAARLGSSHIGLTDRSKGRRANFANARKAEINQEFRISKDATNMTLERAEAYFYNHGMEIALGVLFLALNVLVAGHGAYQFSRLGGWTTDNDVLRVTLPIARAGGRLVTLNCSILLLTACKYLWTLVRTYVTPVVPIGFPIDEIMPKYHRYVALTIIFMGCIVHTLPQIVNYASRSIIMDWSEPIRIWTFGKEFATKQLLITGVLLAIIFTIFFLTTLTRFRRTTAGFRWFWTFHMIGIAMVYPLLIVHGTCFGNPVFLYTALAPLLLYLFDISMRRKNIFSTNVLRWRLHNDDGQEITELALELPKGFSYTPGQYAELKFSPISGREWHPFTIASAPNEEGGVEEGVDDSEKEEITFFIKNCGRWTGALADYASAFELSKARNPPQMFICGPHGAPAMNYIEYKHIIVIGSGVGVTPLLSIWKYLVDKGTALAESAPSADSRKWIENTAAMNLMTESFNVFNSFFMKSNGSDMDFSSSLNFSLDVVSLGDSISNSLRVVESTGKFVIGKHRLRCLKLAKLMESMVVSLSLFIWFVLGGTASILFQLLGDFVAASAFGSFLLLVGFLVHISIVVIWTIALGPKIYFRHFKCWLDCTIIIVDCFALWKFIEGFMMAMQDGAARLGNMFYFLTFGAVTILQAIRVFHILYMTLKAPMSPTSGNKKRDNNEQLKRRSSIVVSDKVEFCSVQGILINRKYSMMKFAARTLFPPILESGLLDVFAMQFYGTREKKKETDEGDDGEHSLVYRMMGSKGDHIDVGGAQFYNKRAENKEFFCPGRPNWNLIFHKAISEAHVTNNEGESIGVCFLWKSGDCQGFGCRSETRNRPASICHEAFEWERLQMQADRPFRKLLIF